MATIREHVMKWNMQVGVLTGVLYTEPCALERDSCGTRGDLEPHRI